MDERNQKIDALSTAIDDLWPICVKNQDGRFGIVTRSKGQLELYIRGKDSPVDPIDFLKSKKSSDEVFPNPHAMVDDGWRLD